MRLSRRFLFFILMLAVASPLPSFAIPGPSGTVDDPDDATTDETTIVGSPRAPRHPRVPHSAWERIANIGDHPSGRAVFSLVEDPVARNVYLFGGYGYGGVQGDLWSLSLETETWTRLNVPGGPGPRWGTMSVYDPVGGRIIVFGGARSPFPGSEDPVNEVWALTLSGPLEWSRILPLGTAPTARFAGVTVYDRMRNRMILFGGFASGTFYNDAWALDLSGTPTWRNLNPAGPLPTGRDAPAAVYDARHDRVVLFGGFMGPNEAWFNDVWALDLSRNRWREISPPGAPSPRREMAWAHDPRHHRMLIFGGGGPPDALSNQVWQLSLTHPPTWTLVEPDSGDAPSPRAGHYAVYDVASNRLVTFGGYAEGVGDEPDFVYSDKTWALAFSRRRDDSSDSPIELEAGPVEASAPLVSTGASRLALTVANPAVQRLSIAFMLPEVAPARLEILTVSGRRIASREVGGMGAGRHTIEVGDGGRVPGIYFVRLTQGSVSVVQKVAVIE